MTRPVATASGVGEQRLRAVEQAVVDDTKLVRDALLAGSGGSLHIEQPTHPYAEMSNS